MIGRAARSRNRPVVNAVEESGRTAGERIAPIWSLAGDEIRLDVVAAGVGGRDQLVGAAVEQKGGAGLLADVRVGTGVVEAEWEGPEGAGDDRFAGPGCVGRDRAVAVDGVGGEAGYEDARALEVLAPPYPHLRDRRTRSFGETALLEFALSDVLEMVGRVCALRVDFRFQHGPIGVNFAHRVSPNCRDAGSRREHPVGAVAGTSTVHSDDSKVVRGVRGEAGQRHRHRFADSDSG